MSDCFKNKRCDYCDYSIPLFFNEGERMDSSNYTLLEDEVYCSQTNTIVSAYDIKACFSNNKCSGD